MIGAYAKKFVDPQKLDLYNAAYDKNGSFLGYRLKQKEDIVLSNETIHFTSILETEEAYFFEKNGKVIMVNKSTYFTSELKNKIQK